MNKVTFLGGHYECGTSCLYDILAPYAEIIDLPITVRNAHGNYPRPNKSKDEFHIYFWSSPSKYGRSTSFSMGTVVFGSEVIGSAKDCYYSIGYGDDLKIINLTSPEGIVAAEWHEDRPNCLHILYDLPHQHASNAKIQLAGIMNEYYLLSRQKEKILLNLTAKLKKEKAKKNRDSNNNVWMLEERLLSVKNAIAEAKEKQFFADGIAKKFAEKEKEEFAKIKKEAGVKSIGCEKIIKTADGDTIIFHTDSGFYEAAIGREKIPFHAICAGSAKAGLAQFIGARQYYAAFRIINGWLKNYKSKRSA